MEKQFYANARNIEIKGQHNPYRSKCTQSTELKDKRFSVFLSKFAANIFISFFSVHFRIHVPEFVKHNHHTKTVYIKVGGHGGGHGHHGLALVHGHGHGHHGHGHGHGHGHHHDHGHHHGDGGHHTHEVQYIDLHHGH